MRLQISPNGNSKTIKIEKTFAPDGNAFVVKLTEEEAKKLELNKAYEYRLTYYELDSTITTTFSGTIYVQWGAPSSKQSSFVPTIPTVHIGSLPVDRRLSAHQTAAELDHPDSSVVTSKLADGAVTNDKLGTDVKKRFSDIEEEIAKKPGTLGENGAALFGDAVENDDTVLAAGSCKTFVEIAKDLSGYMGCWELDGICVGVKSGDVDTFNTLIENNEVIYVTYNGEQIALHASGFTAENDTAWNIWGNSAMPDSERDLWLYNYDNSDFNFMESGLTETTLTSIGYNVSENLFE
ncbi:MAG: hypothetical protein IJ365_00105, partial [Clostridia bacterium]|nr:hypothetical protein [Clostridia bacterium]